MTAAFVLVVTTVADRADATRIARVVVERGLAACAQVSSIDSWYAWQGAVQNEAEFRIVFKAAASAYAAVEAAILELHPYELPAIHAIAVERAHAPYADWVAANSGAGADL